MYSQCPECHARFRVTADALRVAQGIVRCGRCSSAFNALAHLSDVLPEDGYDTTSSPANGRNHAHRHDAGLADDDRKPDAPEESQVAEFSFSADDIEKVFVDARDWQRQFGGAAGSDDLATAGSELQAQVHDRPGDDLTVTSLQPSVLVGEQEQVEDITLEGERIHIEGLPDTIAHTADETGTHRRPDTADETGTHHRPQIADETGTHRTPRFGNELDDTSKMRAAPGRDELAPAAGEQVTPGAVANEAVAGARDAFDDDEQFDLDSTDRFEVLDNVPDSAYPADDDEDDEEDLFVRAMREHDVAPNDGERAASGPHAPSTEREAAAEHAAGGGHAPATERSAAAERATPSERTGPAHDVPLVRPLPATSQASAAAGAHKRPREPVVTPFPRRAASTAVAGSSTAAAPRAATSGTPPARAGTRPDAPNWFADDPVRVADDELRPGRAGDDAQPRSATFWALGGLVLALVLVAQVTHFYRQDLVRDPNIGPILRNIYNGIGIPLAPHWDLDAFEVRQWGADDASATPGHMTVRASIRNRATFAQPLPLLRLEFEDRFGEAVAGRDFEPREYLKDPDQATRMLAPNAATEAELVIVGTSRDAIGGYRLDVCMRDDKLGIRCALSPSR